MKSLFTHIPFLKKAEEAIKTFSLTERIVWFLLVAIFAISGFSLFAKTYSNFLVAVPDKGGSITEGIVGTPRFINPLLAITDADKDLTTLIYSGLMKINSEGKTVTDLAQDYYVSEDGLVYRFSINPKAVFHDNTPVLADDVVFTIESAKDSIIKSPRKSMFDGVSVKALSEREVEFRLLKAYVPFLDNLTIGIMPKHIWQSVRRDQFAFTDTNIHAVGSGPFKIHSIEYDKTNIPTTFTLKPFDKYTQGEPFIRKITIKTYKTSEELKLALEDGDVEGGFELSLADTKDLSEQGFTVHTAKSPRVFGVFFNQNQNEALIKREVREALDMAIDRDQLVNEVLSGYGKAIYGPLPGTSDEVGSIYKDISAPTSTEARIAKSRGILEKAGWTINTEGIYEKKDKTKTITLAFDISTSDTPELKATAERIIEMWKKIGAQVSLHVYESGDLNQNVLRPRKYDALLFGEIVGRDIDLYPFWHSTERNDPGLNIAMYTSIKVDKSLESLRTESKADERLKSLESILTEIKNDHPAVFLYSHNFTYIIPKNLHGITLEYASSASERFSSVNTWYKYTNNVLSIFANNY